jgi:hypothetical protein
MCQAPTITNIDYFFLSIKGDIGEKLVPISNAVELSVATMFNSSNKA